MNNVEYDDLIFRIEEIRDLRKLIKNCELYNSRFNKSVCDNIISLLNFGLEKIISDFQRISLYDLKYKFEEELVVEESKSFSYSILEDRSIIDINKEQEYKNFLMICNFTKSIFEEFGVHYNFSDNNLIEGRKEEGILVYRQINQKLILSNYSLISLNYSNNKVNNSLKKVLKK